MDKALVTPQRQWEVEEIAAQRVAKLTGKVVLNMKDGEVLEIEIQQRKHKPVSV
jgi:hypothetical protein